ncbi:MAG TPA: energy transducer TonB [Longimicrobiales bacterium]
MRGLLCALTLLLAACGEDEPAQLPVEPPQVVSDSTPITYPLELWDQRISGETVLLVRISELGAVDSVLVGKSSGYQEFDSAAVQGARNMRWSAGKQGERRVAMWAKLPVRFARDTAKKMGLGGE